MLEEKDTVFEVDKVIAFRIVTGDEIVGKIVTFDKGSVTLKKPCGLQMNQTTGQVGLAPATVLGHPDKPVRYERSSIVAIMTPRDDAISAYESYATELTIPKKGDLVLPNKK